MVNQYVEARREYQKLMKRYEELRLQISDVDSRIIGARRLMHERLHEAIREQVLRDVKDSGGRIEFRRLKTTYCSTNGFAIDGEGISRLARRELLGYIDELELRGYLMKNNEDAAGRMILVLYAT